LISILISHSDKQQTALTAIDCDLTDSFIETLVEQLLTHWTQSDLSRLSVQQSFLELFVQLDDLDFGGGSGEYGLHPELPIVCSVFFRREDLSEDVFGVVLFVLLLGLGILVGLGRAADQHRCGVLH
jgi:hypothetical protein